MLERLVENWLDNASERSYQAPFCQMLIGKGHKVVHSTRHAPIEQGKDVISIAPDGVPWAFQLKGTPNSQLTLNEFRKIHPQLIELVKFPVKYPGLRKKRHRSFLVTNGYIGEEVQDAIDAFNSYYINARLLHISSREAPAFILIAF